MKLFINSGSPFVRKCRIFVRELGLLAHVSEVETVTLNNAPEHVSVNPFAQIPALETDQDEGLFDSTLICEWLGTRYDAVNRLYPSPDNADAYWRSRRAETLGDSLLEACVKMVIENRRPESERSPSWLRRWEEGLLRGFAASEDLCPEPMETPDLAAITLAVAATYVDFRFPDLKWAHHAPKLVALRDHLEKRQSFIETYPR